MDKELQSFLIYGDEALPHDDYFRVTYHLIPASGYTFEECVTQISRITTLRTHVALPYETRNARFDNAGLILSATGTKAEVAYPMSMASPNEKLGQLQFLLTAAADYKYAEQIWIESVTLPKNYARSCRGPTFGVDGLRDRLGIKDRPVVGLIVKPRDGCKIQAVVDACEEALCGGVDILVDDLLMVDPDSEMSFSNRCEVLSSLVRHMSQVTGERKHYFMNVGTAPYDAYHKACEAARSGVTAVLVNGFIMGFGALQEFSSALQTEIDGGMPVVTTNLGFGIISRNDPHSAGPKASGISETIVSKLSRLAGADAVHAGTSDCDCYADAEWGPAIAALKLPYHGMASCFTVAEGDINLANIWPNMKSAGNDLILEPTTGILNYPEGPREGAALFRLFAEEMDPKMSPKEAHEFVKEVAKNKRMLGQHLEELNFKGYLQNNERSSD